MSTMASLDGQSCPRCAMPLTVVRESDATVVRYDLAGWEQSCERTDCDGPLACPWLKAALQFWLPESSDQVSRRDGPGSGARST